MFVEKAVPHGSSTAGLSGGGGGGDNDREVAADPHQVHTWSHAAPDFDDSEGQFGTSWRRGEAGWVLDDEATSINTLPPGGTGNGTGIASVAQKFVEQIAEVDEDEDQDEVLLEQDAETVADLVGASVNRSPSQSR